MAGRGQKYCRSYTLFSLCMFMFPSSIITEYRLRPLVSYCPPPLYETIVWEVMTPKDKGSNILMSLNAFCCSVLLYNAFSSTGNASDWLFDLDQPGLQTTELLDPF